MNKEESSAQIKTFTTIEHPTNTDFNQFLDTLDRIIKEEMKDTHFNLNPLKIGEIIIMSSVFAKFDATSICNCLTMEGQENQEYTKEEIAWFIEKAIELGIYKKIDGAELSNKKFVEEYFNFVNKIFKMRSF